MSVLHFYRFPKLNDTFDCIRHWGEIWNKCFIERIMNYISIPFSYDIGTSPSLYCRLESNSCIFNLYLTILNSHKSMSKPNWRAYHNWRFDAIFFSFWKNIKMTIFEIDHDSLHSILRHFSGHVRRVPLYSDSLLDKQTHAVAHFEVTPYTVLVSTRWNRRAVF